MRILLLNQYYPPDTAATAVMARRVAVALAQRHQVTVLAGRPSYHPEQRHPLYWRHTETDGPVRVVRVGTTTFSRQRMPGRIANYLTYAAFGAGQALALPADVLVCMTDPPFLALVAATVARLRRLPLVYNIRDLYPEMAVAGGILREGRLVRLWERLHCWALHASAGVIVLGDDMRERILVKGIEPARVWVVRDGAPPATPPAGPHPTIALVRADWPFVAVHAGNLGFYGCWDSLITAARRLTAAGVRLVFVGDGAQREHVVRAAAGATNIAWLPFRPADEVPYVLAAADVQIVCLRRGLEGIVVPSKLYGILAAGQAVLAVAPEASDVARIVRQYGCGLVADPDSPEAIAQALLWMKMHPEQLRTMRERARAAAAEFDQQRQLEWFVTAVESLVQETDSNRFARSTRMVETTAAWSKPDREHPC